MTDEDRANDEGRFILERVRRFARYPLRSTYPSDPDHWAVDYVADEVVTAVDDASELVVEMSRLHVTSNPVDGDPADQVDGTARYTIAPEKGFEGELDPRRLVEQINETRVAGGLPPLTSSAHYVPSIARTRIGPGSDPWPAEPGAGRRWAASISGAPPIGVVDTGVWETIPGPIADPGGPDGLDPYDDDPPPLLIDYPGAGHGGFIAGIIEERAPGVDLISRRADVVDGLYMTEASVRTAGDAAVNAGARILNLSLGTYATGTVILEKAVRRWVQQDLCLVVAAAGNEATDDPWYPAAFAVDQELARGVVSVGACMDGEVAPFSNFGDWVVCWAPGFRVLSWYPRGTRFPYPPDPPSQPFVDGLARWSGTSFAAPVAAAEIARFAAENGFGGDVQGAWAAMREGYRTSCRAASEEGQAKH